LRAMTKTDLAPLRPTLRIADDADLAVRALNQASYRDEQKQAKFIQREFGCWTST